MKVFIALCAVLACASAGLIAPATTLLRAPSHDSAIIQSHRFGGNFAYRTDEAHAYAAISPIISTVRQPVGVSYSQGAPILRSTTVHAAAPVAVAAPAAVATYAAAPFATYAAAAPITTYAAAAPISTYAAAPFATYAAAAPISTYAAAPFATYAAGGPIYSGLHFGHGLGYGYGYAGLPLSIEKAEEEKEAEEAVAAVE